MGITRSLSTSPNRDKDDSESLYGSSERKKHSRLSKLSSTQTLESAAQDQARSSFMLLLQKGKEAASSRNPDQVKEVFTALPKTPEIGAIEEDEEPGGIGKFFKTVVHKKRYRPMKKPPLPKNGSNNEVNLPKQVKDDQRNSQYS